MTRRRRIERAAPPDWLVARPIAHRGLHDKSRAIVENTSSAARAAIAQGFSIECDVQLTRDGDAVVFHDSDLDRLTREAGPLVARSSADLQRIAYAGCEDRIVSLAAFLALVAGQVPLICEIKSNFDGDMRLSDRVRAVVGDYAGPLALKSFDPAVVEYLRPDEQRPLGIVGQADFSDGEWAALPPDARRDLAQMLHFERTQPDFLSYHVDDLPHAAPYLCRAALGLPVMTWTVREPDQRAVAALWADQIVFEGFIP